MKPMHMPFYQRGDREASIVRCVRVSCTDFPAGRLQPDLYAYAVDIEDVIANGAIIA